MANSATVGILRAVLSLNKAEFETGMKSASDLVGKFGQDAKRLGVQATQLGSALTKSLTLPIVGVATVAAKAAIDFESSFAGVRKTVNATEAEFAQLSRGLRDMAKEIPINVNELNRIAEAAGQLGIKTENILGFTDVMAKLGVSTNMAADQAATALARLANITQMPQTEFDRLGSTVVALGNNLATTESEIVDFGLRIAGAGKIAGLTEAQILAIGGAMSSVGVEAEAGGTAVQKVLLGITQAVETNNDKLAVFAQTAGMSAEAFAKAWREDAGAAFTLFVEGLGKAGNQAFEILDQLDLTDQRLIRSFLSLANAGDTLRGSIDLGTKAWSENNALNEEAARRFETTASKLQLFWNRAQDVAIELGGALLPALVKVVDAAAALIPVVETLVKGFTALPGPVQLGVIGLAGVLAAAGPLIWTFGQLAFAVSTLSAAFKANGIAAVALAKTVGGVTVAFAGTAAAIASAMAAFVLLGEHLRTAQSTLGRLTGEAIRHVSIVNQLIDGVRKLVGVYQMLRNEAPKVEGATKRIAEHGLTPTAEAAMAVEREVLAASQALGVTLPSATTKAADGVKKLDDALDQLTGRAKITAARELTRQLEAMAKAGDSLDPDQYQRVADAMSDAIDAAKRLGVDVNPAWLEWYNRTVDLTMTMDEGLLPAILRIGAGLRSIKDMDAFGQVIEDLGRIENAIPGLPGGKVPGQPMGMPAPPPGQKESIWKQMFGSSQEMGAYLASTVVGAIQGGGDVAKALGGGIGTKVGTWAGKAAGNWAGKAIGGALGKAIGGALGSALPVVGTILGSVAGSWIGGLFGPSKGAIAGKQADSEIKAMQADLIATYGSLDNIRKIGGAAGDALADAWGSKNVEGLQWFTQKVHEFNGAVKETKDVADAANPSLADITAAADRYGLSLDDLGPKVQQLRIDEAAKQIVKDFDLLIAAGADVNVVIAAMGEHLQELVIRAIKTGASIPAALRPLLQHMVDAGELTDETGEKLTDLGQLTFAESLTDKIDTLVDVLHDLVDAIRGVGGELDTLGNKEVSPRVRVQYSYDVGEPPDFPGGDVIPSRRSGSPGMDYESWGAGTQVALHGDEAVVPRSGVSSLAADIARELGGRNTAPQRIQLFFGPSSRRALVDAVVREVPHGLEAYGV